MDKLLITGISGFLGWNLSNEALKRYKVYGTVHKNNITSKSISLHKCNIEDKNEVIKLIDKIQPDHIIHAAAISQPAECEKNSSLSEIINTKGSVNIANVCKQYGISLIFTSSDMVFDGEDAPYDEKSEKKPKNIYGRQKSNAEDEIHKILPSAAICRMPLMFGPPSANSESFIQPIVRNLRNSIKTAYFNDEYRTPISSWDVSEFFLNNLGKLSGFFNLGGNERVSRYEFSQKVAEVGLYSKELVQGNSQKDVKLAAPRPKDLTMKNDLASSFGFNPAPLMNSLERLKNEGYL